MGLMKALHFIISDRSRPVKRKFMYEDGGTAVHARRTLKADESAQIDALTKQILSLDPVEDRDQVKSLFSDLSKLPVKFVPVRRQIKIDYSKSYPYRSKKRGG